MIELQYQLTQEEIVSSMRRQMARHPFTIAYLAFLFGSVALKALLQPHWLVGGAVLVLVCVLVVAGAYILYLVMILPQSTYDRMDPSVRQATQSYRFSPTGVEVKTPTAQARYDWIHFATFQESAAFVEIHPRLGGSFIHIPARAFASAEDRARLLDLLASKLRTA